MYCNTHYSNFPRIYRDTEMPQTSYQWRKPHQILFDAIIEREKLALVESTAKGEYRITATNPDTSDMKITTVRGWTAVERQLKQFFK
jgi:hypothetical protein